MINRKQQRTVVMTHYDFTGEELHFEYAKVIVEGPPEHFFAPFNNEEGNNDTIKDGE